MNANPGIRAYGRSRLARISEKELDWCLWLNRTVRWQPVERVFAVVSRLGNGVFWYVLMLAMLLFYGHDAVPAVTCMLITGVIGVVLYKLCKRHTSRHRPYTRNQAIQASVAPLDQYSFPSGHTLHAVGFSLVAIHYFPELTWLLIPFALLVALSRVVLGLHYPSDVIAGATVGALLAALVLNLPLQ